MAVIVNPDQPHVNVTVQNPTPVVVQSQLASLNLDAGGGGGGGPVMFDLNYTGPSMGELIHAFDLSNGLPAALDPANHPDYTGDAMPVWVTEPYADGPTTSVPGATQMLRLDSNPSGNYEVLMYKPTEDVLFSIWVNDPTPFSFYMYDYPDWNAYYHRPSGMQNEWTHHTISVPAGTWVGVALSLGGKIAKVEVYEPVGVPKGFVTQDKRGYSKDLIYSLVDNNIRQPSSLETAHWGVLTESFIDSTVRSTHAAQGVGVSNGGNLTLTHTGNLYYTNYLSDAQRGNIQSVTAQLVVPTNYTAAQGINLYGYVIVNPQGRMTLTHRAADTRYTETWFYYRDGTAALPIEQGSVTLGPGLYFMSASIGSGTPARLYVYIYRISDGPEIRGVGSPEGVYGAPINVKYLQTDSTPPLRWIKTTDTGNTGWMPIGGAGGGGSSASQAVIETSSVTETIPTTNSLVTWAVPVATTASFADHNITAVTNPNGVVFTIHVTGYENVTWAEGIEVIGSTIASEVWLTVVRENDTWKVIVPADTSGQYAVNDIPSAFGTVTIPANASAHKAVLTADTTFAFEAPVDGHTFSLHLTGTFNVTWPESVQWHEGVAPTYSSPAVFVFSTFDAGATWIGSLVGANLA